MRKIFFLAIIATASCSAPKNVTNTTTSASNLVADGKLFTALFQQKAAEYKALCFQAYNIARLRLDQSLSNPVSAKPKAIVTDIDETVLDNSPYAVHQGLQGKDYEPVSWINEWTVKADADTLAGAYSFFKYAASKNVEVFYITNREDKERASTLQNLQKFGFPYADERHLVTKSTVSSKEPRRQQLAATHDIIMLIGDNLSDFSTLFDKRSTEERTKNVQANAGEFGNKFIVLPNANYGDWESALYNYNYKLTAAQKDSVIKSVLKNY